MVRGLLRFSSAAAGLLLLMGDIFGAPHRAHAQTQDPVFVGAGDIANCRGGQDEATAALLDSIPGTVFTLGDNAYDEGTLAEFYGCYDPGWGRQKARTRPSPGNHDYDLAGAAGYFTYFGAAASPLDAGCAGDCRGYYSYNLGEWHIIALNSEVDHAAGSAQEQWLRADLAAHTSTCTLAYWHEARFSSGEHGNNPGIQSLWQALYDFGADVVLSAHDHMYERFAPQDPQGRPDAAHGIRQFTVGTGGATLYALSDIQANSEVRNTITHGVLKLTLHAGSYDWQFIPIPGETFTDSDSANCVTAGGPSRVSGGNGLLPAGKPIMPPRASDTILADDFENGVLSTWNPSKGAGSRVSLSPGAALAGGGGLEIALDTRSPAYVIDDSPFSEKHYRVKFALDPNSIGLPSGAPLVVFGGMSGLLRPALTIEVRREGSAFEVRASMLNDWFSWAETRWYTISDTPHSIEVDWRASDTSKSRNGGLILWVDGVLAEIILGWDNDTRRIDRVELGAVSGPGLRGRGSLHLDTFQSFRGTYLGTAR